MFDLHELTHSTSSIQLAVNFADAIASFDCAIGDDSGVDATMPRCTSGG